jgi:hypothetical protein
MRPNIRESCLIQLLLPVTDNAGRRFPDSVWEGLKDKLVERFGGVTAFARTPAEGVWEPSPDRRTSEDVFVVEVMSETFEVAWWSNLQMELESSLAQEHVVIRAIGFKEII